MLKVGKLYSSPNNHLFVYPTFEVCTLVESYTDSMSIAVHGTLAYEGEEFLHTRMQSVESAWFWRVDKDKIKLRVCKADQLFMVIECRENDGQLFAKILTEDLGWIICRPWLNFEIVQ